MLNPGTKAADQGMAGAIFGHVDAVLGKPLQDKADAATGDAKVAAQKMLDEARVKWRELSFAIAAGVVEYLRTNLEIHGVRTGGAVAATVAGQTESSAPSAHRHGIGVTASQAGVVFVQTNDGVGLIR
ncbi:hypothetical protein [Paractinoplanes durhamensis]|uniref:Uncharacterized protein n=1 Tax=Paractinoplanes durhamensis TaxID=113563 RepID=A0ABQ3Z760_9ACTN|nr:hypothetical protein [Actinoplanes durhamensis]GIE05666.1 hypothetical protein Adu01nite_70160 [Actinoplanes durhamensis]